MPLAKDARVSAHLAAWLPSFCPTATAWGHAAACAVPRWLAIPMPGGLRLGCALRLLSDYYPTWT